MKSMFSAKQGSLATGMSREFQSPVTRLSQTVLFCLVVIQLA